MSRPSFQFYPKDWRGSHKLQRCTHEEKGVWMDIMCVLHDADEYGLIRFTLSELARIVGAKMRIVQSLMKKGVLKGVSRGECKCVVQHTFTRGEREGETVNLIENEVGPVFFSSRMLRDEFIRGERSRHGKKSLEHPNVPKPKNTMDHTKDTNMDTIAPSMRGSPTPSPSPSEKVNKSLINESEEGPFKKGDLGRYKNKLYDTISLYKEFIHTSTGKLVEVLSKRVNWDIAFIWSAAVQSRDKDNPAAFLSALMADPKFTPSDKSQKVAAKEMEEAMKKGKGYDDLTDQINRIARK